MSQYHQIGAWLPKFCPRQVKSLRGLGSLGSADVPDLDDRNKPAGELKAPGAYFCDAEERLGLAHPSMRLN
jgi:hypothetical protein